jgi:hypothetical protein
MMFGREDRAWLREDRALLVRLEAKIDIQQSQIQVIQQKQATHEAICDQREAIAEKYREALANREGQSEAEWSDFQKESRDDRARIREDVWSSMNQLQWRIIGALFGIVALAAGIIVTVVEHGFGVK